MTLRATRIAPQQIAATVALRKIATRRNVRAEASTAPLPIRNIRRVSEQIDFRLYGSEEDTQRALDEFDQWLDANGVF